MLAIARPSAKSGAHQSRFKQFQHCTELESLATAFLSSPTVKLDAMSFRSAWQPHALLVATQVTELLSQAVSVDLRGSFAHLHIGLTKDAYVLSRPKAQSISMYVFIIRTQVESSTAQNLLSIVAQSCVFAQ